jgi:hypothetical protein
MESCPADCQSAKQQVANLRYEGAAVACEECGQFDAMKITGCKRCPDCLTLTSSSCTGSPDDGGC